MVDIALTSTTGSGFLETDFDQIKDLVQDGGVDPTSSSVIVTKTGTQTLTNKTLTTPVISSISNSGTITVPTGTDTLVGKATTDTLTNKTFDTNGTGNTFTVGKELDLGANSIGGTAQSATGDGTTTIDWGSGNVFNFQFGAFNETFTFTAPTKPGTFLLKLVQDSVGSRTATWPATVKWPGGSAPTLTTTATTGTDIITFYYDGTNYFSVSQLNFS